VVEVASWWFVPAAGAVLTDWGADVIKVEPPDGGDPQRALLSSGLLPTAGNINFMMGNPTGASAASASTSLTPTGSNCSTSS